MIMTISVSREEKTAKNNDQLLYVTTNDFAARNKNDQKQKASEKALIKAFLRSKTMILSLI